MTPRSSLRSLLLAALVTAGCGSAPEPSGPAIHDGTQATGDAQLFSFAYATDPAPMVRGSNSVTLTVIADGAPLAGAQVQLQPFMPAHGHGSPSEPTVTELDGGRYRFDDVVFTMPGSWNLIFDATKEGRHDHVVFAVPIP